MSLRIVKKHGAKPHKIEHYSKFYKNPQARKKEIRQVPDPQSGRNLPGSQSARITIKRRGMGCKPHRCGILTRSVAISSNDEIGRFSALKLLRNFRPRYVRGKSGAAFATRAPASFKPKFRCPRLRQIA